MNPARYSKIDYIKSSPYFFRLIRTSVLVLCTALFCGSILVPSPLLGPADVGSSPNPAKSAWFLLWIQELVSHATYLIYPVILMGLMFVFLPWLPVYRPVWRASWFPEAQRWVNVATITAIATILILTIIAAYFRGPQWQFMLPF